VIATSGMTPLRRGLGLTLAALVLPAMTALLVWTRGDLALGSILLLYLLAVVVISVVGGIVPGLLAGVGSFLLVNFFLTPPYHTFSVDSRDSVVALLVFLVVATTVSVVVEVAARRRVAAAAEAERARELAEVDRLRSALLAAASHDLRTPIASIKAAATTLDQPGVEISDPDRAELLETIVAGADRLSDLIGNLLDLSRLEAGALTVDLRPVALDEVVARALIDHHLPEVTNLVTDDLPLVRTDAGLLERVVANLVDNAFRHAEGAGAVELAAEAGTSSVVLHVVDHGPGVEERDWPRMFVAFQRLDAHRSDGGVGLGLAIARGFTEAVGGTLEPATTPGGGLTMSVTLPTAGAGP